MSEISVKALQEFLEDVPTDAVLKVSTGQFDDSGELLSFDATNLKFVMETDEFQSTNKITLTIIALEI